MKTTTWTLAKSQEVPWHSPYKKSTHPTISPLQVTSALPKLKTRVLRLLPHSSLRWRPLARRASPGLTWAAGGGHSCHLATGSQTYFKYVAALFQMKGKWFLIWTLVPLEWKKKKEYSSGPFLDIFLLLNKMMQENCLNEWCVQTNNPPYFPSVTSCISGKSIPSIFSSIITEQRRAHCFAHGISW